MGVEQLSMDTIPEIDVNSTKAEVIGAFRLYRVRKHCNMEELEPVITPSYEPRYHGNTNTTSDPTAKTALHNSHLIEMYKYCRRIEQAVERLQPEEKLIMQERYMKDYVKDYQVYNFIFKPPISHNTYREIRNNALIKLAHSLGLVKFRQKKCKKKDEKSTL
ncbi:transcriptional regulator [Paenibacillus alvei]|uniref:Transcriptional regulator n=1 Tax=Paenibacillus alvei TaxID=44250 RepID=A0ABT4H876_PAEAL|nr:ArpU family phage packaging/lysis transcriptional regulator [Paenibacillus alvei]MCY9765089.1 transcriptional regulator [Paenibacillus alvei]MCY9771432.1 transcriptional regulator [Paenibacillus alvei]